MSKKKNARPMIDRKPRILVLEGLSGGSWAMECVGAEVVSLSPSDEETFDQLSTLSYDGLLLTGGGDVSPALYGQKPHSKGYGYDPMRDFIECAALEEARKRNIPVLGICRGAQIMAVEGGGKLRQHLEGHVGYDHSVTPMAGTMFGRLMRGTPHQYVVSLHHQVVAKVGRQWQIAAVDRIDGTVEAVESKDGRCLGVQFHPEMDRGEEYAHRILHWLAQQAAKRAHLVPVIRPALPVTGQLGGDYKYGDACNTKENDSYTDWELRAHERQLGRSLSDDILTEADSGRITAETSMFRSSATTTNLVRHALSRAATSSSDVIDSIGYWCSSCGMVFDERRDRDDHELLVCGVYDHVPATGGR